LQRLEVRESRGILKTLLQRIVLATPVIPEKINEKLEKFSFFDLNSIPNIYLNTYL
jgi:hypothetical protein